MATSREERPYDAVLGTGGKFRKRPFRRSQPSTPYDRPPTAIRSVSAVDSNGWLSKLVDPAHRLISAGAHRLFSSVFRKRLLPPTVSSPQEAGRVPREERQEAVSSDPSGAKEMPSNGNNNPSSSSDRGGLSELEQILKQKTFTRSEVDLLTTLLRSRSDEIPIGDEEKRFEMVPSKPTTALDRKEGYRSTTPLQVNGIKNRLTPTPFVNATVLDDDVASPTEVAKAYMGSRTSKVSPSMLSLRSQKFREDINVISNPLLPRSPIMSLVPVASGPVSVPLNGFMTPRSRGRSAIYNMARTPYSRVNRPSTFKDTRTIIDTFGGPSSSSTLSHSELELNRPSGSHKGGLKRRSSVLDNDIGSVGPMRRIRQKANLLSQKGLGSPHPAQYPSSSKMLLENGDKKISDTSITPVPTKSKEMASKILQQLDKFTPKEKSPTKLSPSMLRGKALKSLESPDTAKVFERADVMNKLDGLVDSSLPDGQKSISQKKEQDVVNSPRNILSLYNASAVTSVDNMVLAKDTVPSVNIDNTRMKNCTACPPQRKRAFQMSAHEDFVDLDDDILSNGVASTTSVEPKAKLVTSVVESRTVTPESVNVVKPSSEDKPPAGSISNEKSNGSIVDAKSTGFAFSTASGMTIKPAMGAIQTSFASDKPTFFKESNAPHPIFSFGDQVAPSKVPIAGSPTLDLGSKNAGKTSQSLFGDSSTPADSAGLKCSSSISPGAINFSPEVPAPAVAGSENNSKSGVKSESLTEAPETAQVSAILKSTPSAGICTFGGSSKSTLNNDSNSSSTSPLSSSVPHLFSGNTTGQNSFGNAAVASLTNSTTATSSSSLPLSAPDSSLTATHIIKFGSSAVPSNSVLPTSGGSAIPTEESTVKQDASFGNSSSAVFGGVTLAPTNTGSNIFGFSAPAASTASSQSQVSTLFGTSNGSLSSPAGSAVEAVTQSLPTQFGSSGSTPSFGLPSSSSFSFGSSTFGSSTSAGTLFSSGSGFTASVSANAVSSSSGTSSGLFGSTEQLTKSPIFGSFNSSSASTGFSFGASSVSAASTTTAALPFGSSTTTVAPASSSPMPFGSSTTPVAPASSSPMPFGSSTTPVAPVSSSPMTFGSSTSFGAVANSATIPFGSTNGSSSGSPFSFTSAATGSSNGTSVGSAFPLTSPLTSKPVFGSPSPVFGFSATSSPAGNDQMNTDSMAEDNVQASATPASTFSQQPFSPAPSSFAFGSTAAAPAPVGANPFQFGGQQQNAATQPFQFGGAQQNAASQPFQFGGTQQNPTTQPFQFGGPQQNTATQPQGAASPFQASGSLDFNASGNFSLGSGGGDKSNRRIVKVNKGKYRRK